MDSDFHIGYVYQNKIVWLASVLRIRIRDPGSGIGYLFDPWIRDPGSGMGESQHQDPGSGMNNPDHIF
jgi:hypothetical protein